METISNPQMSIDELSALESKIKSNLASIDDFSRLREFLLSLGIESLFDNLLTTNNFSGLADFVARKHGNEYGRATVVGGILGIITALKNYIGRK